MNTQRGQHLSANGRFLQAVEFDQRQLEVNPLQKALDDYHIMERDRDRAQAEATELHITNRSLLAETSMLREALDRADTDRIRLQAISSTLLGRLLAINDCIGGAVKASIKEGIDAVHAAKAEDELDRDGEDVQAILQRVQPQQPPETPAERTATHEPPQARAATVPRNQFLR